MSEHIAEPDTRERNPKVQMAWGLLAPYIASEDPPDLSDDDQAEILTAGALPQVWSIMLELEADNEEADRLLLAAALKYTGLEARLSKMEEALKEIDEALTSHRAYATIGLMVTEALAGEEIEASIEP